MIYTNMKSEPIGADRMQFLQQSAYRLRQHSIKIGCDLEGWRLARRMRDAASLPQANAAERDFGVYLRNHGIDAARAA